MGKDFLDIQYWEPFSKILFTFIVLEGNSCPDLNVKNFRLCRKRGLGSPTIAKGETRLVGLF